MNLPQYNKFTEALQKNLEGDPRVLGLIAVGSMAQLDTKPDEWSDHDFFVVVPPGVQEEYRRSISWLPDHPRVVFQFRETMHGVKVLYEHGHMLEFAVFDPDELHLARVNRFRILFDRGDLERRMAEISTRTREWSRSEVRDDSYLFGQFLTGLLVAYGRWVRGEKLSARSFLVRNALGNLVQLLVKYVPADSPDVLDNIDPFRRFEFGYKELGARINEILESLLPATAAGLLNLAEQELSRRMPDFPRAALEAVRRRM